MSDPTTVYDFSVWCIEEQKYTTQWGTSVPIICTSSYSHTGAREIDTAKTVSVRNISENLVSVKEQYGGYFQRTTLEFSITGATGLHLIDNFSNGDQMEWKNDIIVWNIELMPDSANVGDIISIVASPDTTIGYLAIGASTGATFVHTQATVTDNKPTIIRGIDIAITDGVHYQNVERITYLDSATGVVGFTRPLQYAFPQFSLIKANIRTVRNQKFKTTEPICVARKGIQGKRVDAGTKNRLEYYNHDGVEKMFSLDLEFYYDK